MLLEVDDDSFDRVVLRERRPVLVDFWSPRCRPCYALARELETLSAVAGELILIVKINMDENPRRRGEFEICRLPALGLFKKGGFVRLIGGPGERMSSGGSWGSEGPRTRWL